jgi:5,10-methylenetetrahydrofolate reductase
VSFEFFPPKSEKMEEQLWAAIQTLAPLGPRFVSVTYGAGGSTRERTHSTVARIASETAIPAAAHLTCVEATKAEVDEIARAYWEAGVRHIVALRGDPPTAGAKFEAHPDGYRNAADLVAGLKKVAPFEISVAAYPECHPDSANPQVDIDNLKAKIDAGATRAITQFFFSPECFFRFRDRAAAAGITAEILPGILPVSNVAQTRKIAGLCGAEIPSWMDRLFEGLDDHPSPASSSPRRSRRSCAAGSTRAEYVTSISTRSTGRSSPTRSAICSACATAKPLWRKPHDPR